MSNDIIFKIPLALKNYSILEMTVAGRIYALSKGGSQLVRYSNADAYRDGFTKTYPNAIAKLIRDKVFICKKGLRGCRELAVNEAYMSEDITLIVNVPQVVMKDDNLSFVEKIIYGRIYVKTQQGKKKIKLTTQMLAKEFNVSSSTIQRALIHLKELNFISTENVYNGFTSERFVTLETVKLTISNYRDLTTQLSRFDYSSYRDLTISSSSKHELYKHELNKHELLEKNQNKKELPTNAQDCEIYFRDYIEKYSSNIPALATVDVTAIAIEFFEYWSGRDWTNDKKQKVKSIRGAVATWIKNAIKFSKPNVRKDNSEYHRSYEEDAKDSVFLADEKEERKRVALEKKEEDLFLGYSELPF